MKSWLHFPFMRAQLNPQIKSRRSKRSHVLENSYPLFINAKCIVSRGVSSTARIRLIYAIFFCPISSAEPQLLFACLSSHPDLGALSLSRRGVVLFACRLEQVLLHARQLFRRHAALLDLALLLLARLPRCQQNSLPSLPCTQKRDRDCPLDFNLPPDSS